jgi:hypothetical protein
LRIRQRGIAAMTPDKQRSMGLFGCRLVSGGSRYRLPDGSFTVHLAVPVSLLLAEPALRRWQQEGELVDCRDAEQRGYRFVRTYDDAVAYGLL